MGVYHYIIALLALGMIGTLYVVLDQTVTVNIYQNITLDNQTSAYNFTSDSVMDATDFMSFWRIVPIIFLVAVCTYLVYKSMVPNQQQG